jgi:hypothetical protein
VHEQNRENQTRTEWYMNRMERAKISISPMHASYVLAPFTHHTGKLQSCSQVLEKGRNGSSVIQAAYGTFQDTVEGTSEKLNLLEM